MKRFFKAVIVVMVLVLGSQFVSAQELNPKQKQKVERDVENLTKIMTLDADQQEKIHAIKVEQTIEKAEIIEEHEAGSAGFKAANKAMNKKYLSNIEAVVSKEQMDSWTAHKAKKKK